MLVNHFNSLLDGGAATAARRLHDELLKSGVESRFHYSASQDRGPELDRSFIATRWQGRGLPQDVRSAVEFRVNRHRFKRTLRGRPEGHEIFTSPRGSAHTPFPPVGYPVRPDQTDIIHLHWIAKFLDYTSFFGSLDSDQPIVWTLHDMNALTGGCHFVDGCQKFRTGCGTCPQLNRPMPDDVSRRFFAEKLAAVEGKNLHIVAPSRWLLDAAESSPLLAGAKSFSHIPYGISANQYYPMDRREARARLGIDPDVMLFCFGAMDVKSRRKGAHQMMRALDQLSGLRGVEGLVFGSGELNEPRAGIPKIHQIGSLQGTLAQRTVYSAADAFVLPSLEDNLPLTGLEAMACGTPVVGFAAGGIPDYVIGEKTGLLAKTGDAEELGQQLRRLVTDRAMAHAMGRSARHMIESRFAADQEAKAYHSLYEELLGTKSQFLRRAA